MIKEGNDHFEVSRQEPKVDFCEKKYVFDAIRAPNATRDPVFNASAKCPAYAIPEELADAVQQKQEADNAEYNKLVSQGHAGRQAQHRHRRRHEPDLRLACARRQHRPLRRRRRPGPVAADDVARARHHPRHRQSAARAVARQQGVEPVVAAAAPPQAPAAQHRRDTRRLRAPPPTQQSEGFFASLARKVGIGGADTTASRRRPRLPSRRPEAKPLPKAFKPVETKQADNRPVRR